MSRDFGKPVVVTDKMPFYITPYKRSAGKNTSQLKLVMQFQSRNYRHFFISIAC
jgi:hypothetical protein